MKLYIIYPHHIVSYTKSEKYKLAGWGSKKNIRSRFKKFSTQWKWIDFQDGMVYAFWKILRKEPF